MPTESRAAWTEALSVVHPGGARALQAIDLSLERGGLTALVGANGSGKSTLIGVLAGTVAPSSGRAFVLGTARHARVGSSTERALRARIAHAPQSTALDPESTARSHFSLFAVLHGIAREHAKTRIAALVDLFGLERLLDRRIARLSGGERRRVHLACALLREAELVLLDEPTAGIDARTSDAAWKELATRAREGAAVLVATHELEQVQRFASEVLILDAGRVLERGPPRELVARHARSHLVATFRQRPASEQIEAFAASFPGARGCQILDRELMLEVDDARASAAELLARLSQHGLAVETLELREPSLATVHRALTGKDLEATDESGGQARPRLHRRATGKAEA